MNKRVTKAITTCLLGASLLIMAGCGSTNVMDKYSFGNQVIQSGQSEITVALPYEMGKSTATITSNDGYPIDVYGSASDHMLIQVEARRPAATKALPTVDEFAMKSGVEFKKIKGDVKVDTVSLNGVPAKKVSATFTNQGKKFSFLQYVFLDKNVLWNIVYQYPTDDQVGADISKQIEDKIQVTQKKEG